MSQGMFDILDISGVRGAAFHFVYWNAYIIIDSPTSACGICIAVIYLRCGFDF